MLDLPETVRRKAVTAGATRWLADLPDIVADLERDWAISIGRTFQDSTEAYVAEAILADGTPAVLKLLVPRAGDAARNEATLLRLAGGSGCVQLLRFDDARGALLLERLGSSLHDLALPTETRHEILCTVAGRVWRPAPGCGLPTGATKGRWLIDHITAAWSNLGEPCSEQTVAQALACAERRIAAHDDERAVLVHEWNTMQAGASFKLVDPDGLLAEAEYDMGIVMREDPEELMAGHPHDRARWLAQRTGLDATAIWEWGVVERVSTGLIAEAVGLQPIGRQMLAAADRIARDYDGPL
ncbi:MAG: aminoglycoside phosphotransferase family protein [Geodermatophilaceae bacterium]